MLSKQYLKNILEQRWKEIFPKSDQVLQVNMTALHPVLFLCGTHHNYNSYIFAQVWPSLPLEFKLFKDEDGDTYLVMYIHNFCWILSTKH